MKNSYLDSEPTALSISSTAKINHQAESSVQITPAISTTPVMPNVLTPDLCGFSGSFIVVYVVHPQCLQTSLWLLVFDRSLLNKHWDPLSRF
jgi:hypothetical protein